MKRGLKVFTFPFNPLNVPIYKMITQDSEKGDPYGAFKTEFVPYDLLVGNVLATPYITALSPTCRKELAKHEAESCYVKYPYFK